MFHFIQIVAKQCTMAESREPVRVLMTHKFPAERPNMRILGIRDIIGPIMIGPSSKPHRGCASHREHVPPFARGRTSPGGFHLWPAALPHTYRGHGTDKALVAGLLGMAADDERIRDSFEIAKQQDLSFTFEARPNRQCPTPTPYASKSPIPRVLMFPCVREHWRRRGGHHAHQRHRRALDGRISQHCH